MKKWWIAVLLVLCAAPSAFASTESGPITVHDCVDIEFVFARGSGQAVNEGAEWKEFNQRMRAVAVRRGYSYRTIDLRYRAVSVANFQTMFGAYISAGKYYEFGASVNDGVRLLRNYYSDVMAQCSQTKWVLAGYSQGAMVVAEAVKSFVANDVVYIGLFGDPQLSLPEGKGLWPDACRGRNLSEYRVYVPTCQTDNGILKERNPYQYGELRGKYGLWCAKDDYICGSSKNPLRTDGHYTYADIGIAWMSEIVALRLPQKSLARRNVSLASDRATVYAILPMTDYYAAAGENVKFDAGDSFSVGGEIVSYEWNLGVGWVAGDSSLDYAFSNDAEVQVRVTDASGVSAIARANIWIGQPTNNILPAPDVVVVKDKANISYLLINNVPDGAQYILVRLNGFDLGYAEIGDRVRIGELNYSDDELLSFAYMDEEYNIGESSSISSSEIGVDETIGFDMGDFEKPNGDTDPGYNVEPVATGILLSDGDCLVIAGVAILVLLLFFMHKKDACRSGKRPREGP